jgi:hypothetical protein
LQALRTLSNGLQTWCSHAVTPSGRQLLYCLHFALRFAWIGTMLQASSIDSLVRVSRRAESGPAQGGAKLSCHLHQVPSGGSAAKHSDHHQDGAATSAATRTQPLEGLGDWQCPKTPPGFWLPALLESTHGDQREHHCWVPPGWCTLPLVGSWVAQHTLSHVVF